MTTNTPELWDRLNALRMIYEEREGYELAATLTEEGVVLRGNAAGLLALASQLAQMALASDPGAPLQLKTDRSLSDNVVTMLIERIQRKE